MTTISPSVLSANFLQLESEIRSLDSIDDLWIHLDIMDGHFVPNLTFGPVVIKKLHTITRHKLDAHLMVDNPSEQMEWFKDCGLHHLTFHWEPVDHHDRLIEKARALYPSVGVSINPSTSIEMIPDYILQKIDLVLIMSVNPGFGGQSFLPYAIDKVRELARRRRDLGLRFSIQVDGGVTHENARDLISAGADNLVAGSYIFGSQDYAHAVQALRS